MAAEINPFPFEEIVDEWSSQILFLPMQLEKSTDDEFEANENCQKSHEYRDFVSISET